MEGLVKPKPSKFHEPIVLGMIGRLDAGKGFDLCIKALSILKKKNINCKLKIGGFSADKEVHLNELKELIKTEHLTNSVEFLGKITNKDEFYKQIDILVVASKDESFGIVALEGFKYSKPVVSSETDGAKIVIRNNENGLLFSIGDYEELSQKIILLLNKPGLAKKIVDNGFNTAKEMYAFKVVSDDINKKLLKIKKDFYKKL